MGARSRKSPPNSRPSFRSPLASWEPNYYSVPNPPVVLFQWLLSFSIRPFFYGVTVHSLARGSIPIWEESFFFPHSFFSEERFFSCRTMNTPYLLELLHPAVKSSRGPHSPSSERLIRSKYLFRALLRDPGQFGGFFPPLGFSYDLPLRRFPLALDLFAGSLSTMPRTLTRNIFFAICSLFCVLFPSLPLLREDDFSGK